MTLVVALTNDKEAVLLADSLRCDLVEEMYYSERNIFQKIFLTADPRFAVGVAGTSSAANLFLRVKKRQENQGFQDFRSFLVDTREKLKKEYEIEGINFGSGLYFLFIGIDQDGPQIYLISCEERDGKKIVSDAQNCGPRKSKAIGAVNHGAQYILWRFSDNNLDTEQLIALGSYSIVATAEFQPTVSKEIAVAVASAHDSPIQLQRLSKEQIAELSSRITSVESLVTQPLSQG